MAKDTRAILRNIRIDMPGENTMVLEPGEEDELEEVLEALAEEEGQPSKEDHLKNLTIRGAIKGWNVDIDEDELLFGSHDADLRAKALRRAESVQEGGQAPRKRMPKRGAKKAAKKAASPEE